MAQAQGRKAYRKELLAEFDGLFPPGLFRKMPRHGNDVWKPRLVMGFTCVKSRTPATARNEHHWRLTAFWMLQHMAVSGEIAAGQNPRRFSAATARREIREVLQLMQQGRSETPLAARRLKAQTDSSSRRSPKATGDWPRKKNDKPPRPPKIKTAKANEIQKAKQLGFKFLLIS